MEKKDIEHIIARYLSGEAAGEEMMTLMEWLSADEDNKTEFRKIQSYWNAEISMHNLEFIPDFENLRYKIEQSEVQKNRNVLWLRPALVAAVSIIAVIIISHLMLKMDNDEVFTYITGSSISDFVLPDGTQVALNKDSKLTYNESFGRNNRIVSLDGEAYFDVVHDMKQQFVVNAGDAKITVFGTVFSVKSKKGEDILKTSLIEGSVRFETPDQTILLTPHKQILYNTHLKEVTVEKFDPEIEVAWKDNLIKYKSVSFSELISLLQKHYEVNIVLPSEELKSSKLTGTIDAGQSISQILDMMKNNINFEWRKENEDYMIIY